jgi:formate dehydrogenase assembly factor FdhD
MGRVTTRCSTADQTVNIAASTLTAMPDRLRSAQKVFASTGGLHGAAAFNPDGTIAGGAGGHRPPQLRRQGDRLGA